MCCHHRYPGVGMVVLGLIIGTLGAIHHFGGCCQHARFEQHVAEVCVKAAEQVHR
jgi:hypothetical protein